VALLREHSPQHQDRCSMINTCVPDGPVIETENCGNLRMQGKQSTTIGNAVDMSLICFSKTDYHLHHFIECLQNTHASSTIPEQVCASGHVNITRMSGRPPCPISDMPLCTLPILTARVNLLQLHCPTVPPTVLQTVFPSCWWESLHCDSVGDLAALVAEIYKKCSWPL